MSIMLFERKNGSLSFREPEITHCYRRVNDSIRRVLSRDGQPHTGHGSRKSAMLFNAPSVGRRAYDSLSSESKVCSNDFVDSYFADVPQPCLFHELDNPELDRFIKLLGPDVMRANFLSGNLVNKASHRPLVSGGACALETWATRLLAKSFLKENPGLRREVLLELLKGAPYYTHVTGTMMLGTKACPQVMYDETYPWFMTIFDIGNTGDAQDAYWNLESVEALTRDLYERIYAAVVRRSTLVSGENTETFRLPFDSLELEKSGRLEQWYRQYIEALPPAFRQYVPLDYRHDSFIGAYVRYTYVGPDLLNLVKQLLGDRSQAINDTTIHVRTKQDDHLYEGRRINRLLLQGIHKDDHDFLSNYSNICNLAIYFRQQHHWEDNNAFVGFTDLSFQGNIVHDTINLNTGRNTIKSEEELWDIIRCPIRLGRRNVLEHFRYLDRYIDEACLHEEVVAEMVQLRKRRDKHRRKLVGAIACFRERALVRRIVSEILATSTSGQDTVFVTNSDMVKYLGSEEDAPRLKRGILGIPNRYRRNSRLRSVADSAHLFDQLQTTLSCETPASGIRVYFGNIHDGLRILLQTLDSVLGEELHEHEDRTRDETQHLAVSSKKYADFLALHASVSAQEPDHAASILRLFPLDGNAIYCHAIQLSFDPDIACFLIDAEGIEASKLDMPAKRRLLVAALRLILPRIKACLRMIMTEGSRAHNDPLPATYEPVFSRELVTG